MKKISHIQLLLWILSASYSFSINAQDLTFSNMWHIGENNISEGPFINTSLWADYQQNALTLETAVLLNVHQTQAAFPKAIMLRAAKDTVLSAFPFTLKANYLLLPAVKNLRESNINLIASKQLNYFTASLGFNFKTYTYTKEASENYSIEERRFHENWSLLYDLNYTYYPTSKRWQLGVHLTNYDDFIYNQDMNPYFRLKSTYKIRDSLSAILEANYIKSGIFNSSSNSYAYYFKTGIKWHVK